MKLEGELEGRTPRSDVQEDMMGTPEDTVHVAEHMLHVAVLAGVVEVAGRAEAGPAREEEGRHAVVAP